MMKKSSLFLLSSIPHWASACSVCFGGGDSKLAKGFTWGILILGALPFLMLIPLISIIVRTSRKNKI